MQIRWRLKRYRWLTADRERLPAATALGRNYFCCHARIESPAILLTLHVDDSETQVPIHPLCCSSAWARVCFFLSARRAIRQSLPDRSLRRLAFRKLLNKLKGTVVLPDIKDFREFALEGRNRREGEHRDRRDAKSRMAQAERFLVRKGVAGIAVPECFQFLGFDEMPAFAELEKRYRQLVVLHHPDFGGCSEMAKKVLSAFDEARRYFK